jgi:hypothetical protein
MLNDIERTVAAVDPARAFDLGSVPESDAQELLSELMAQTTPSRLRRRRGPRRGVSVLSLTAVAVAAAIGAIIVAGDPAATHETIGRDPSTKVDHSHPGPSRAPQVRLVAYTGEQLQGFVVHQIPQGWYLQGSNAFRLTLAPRGDTTSADAFVGKLVVMLLSRDAAQRLPEGAPIRVGEHDGVIEHSDDVDTLTYRDDAGHFVQIEAWRARLKWTDQQLASFAENVQVTAEAQPTRG